MNHSNDVKTRKRNYEEENIDHMQEKAFQHERVIFVEYDFYINAKMQLIIQIMKNKRTTHHGNQSIVDTEGLKNQFDAV